MEKSKYARIVLQILIIFEKSIFATSVLSL